MTMQFQKATRQAVKLKLAIAGPSGSGKTLGALALARTLAGESGTVALIDTENGSASLYGDKYAFDVLNLAPPYTSARYLEAMEAAVNAGYTVLVIDSLSHQWSGDGGILSRKEEMDRRPGSNSYTNWATFTKEHTAFVAKLLHLPVHIVATMRSKQDYVLETNERGKQTPRKVGMAPVQREGLEYEFSAVFDVGMDHRAVASKDRTDLFGDEPVDLVKAAVGKKLLAWLASGAPAVVAPVTAPVVEGEQRERPTSGGPPSNSSSAASDANSEPSASDTPTRRSATTPPQSLSAAELSPEDVKVNDKRLGDHTDNELKALVDRFTTEGKKGYLKAVKAVQTGRSLGDMQRPTPSADAVMAGVHAAVEAEDAQLPFK